MKRYRIKDICDTNQNTLSSKNEITEIEYLDTGSITENMISETQILKRECAPSRAQRIVKNNTIIYSSVRPNLKHYGILKNPSSNFIVSTGFITLDIKNEMMKEIEPGYLFYLLTQNSITYYLHSIGQNSVSSYPSINPSDIENLSFSFPDLSEQQRIAKILSTIDAKIELNKKINRKLETMAKELYDYWFVQFDFPNEQGKPYKSSGGKMVWNETLKREIPEGWEVSTVGKTINKIPNTARIPSSEYLRDGLIPVIDQSSDFIAGYTNNPDSVLKSKSGYIVFGDHTRIVKYIRFPFERGADGTQVLKSNNPCIPEELFYQIIKSIDLSNYGYARHFKFLKDTLIVIPEKNISGNFAEITKPIYEKQAKLVFENIELSKLRDWLLPMLMNGQARVE